MSECLKRYMSDCVQLCADMSNTSFLQLHVKVSDMSFLHFL